MLRLYSTGRGFHFIESVAETHTGKVCELINFSLYIYIYIYSELSLNISYWPGGMIGGILKIPKSLGKGLLRVQ